MEMPHWFKVPSICNAVCHFERDLKHHTQKKKNSRKCYKLKKYTINSIILKHKVQISIPAPLPFPFSAYFIQKQTENFTAIFYAHGRTINMEVSSMESWSLFCCFFFFNYLRRVVFQEQIPWMQGATALF